MPELPEVQTVVNDLNLAAIPGKTITEAQVFWQRTIEKLSPEECRRNLIGQTVTAIWRRAKYIVFDFASGAHLLIHLKMSGRLHITTPDSERSKHEHVILHFDDNRQLRFHDTRKFGRVYFTHDLDTILGHLGPEPLEASFTATLFAERLHRHKRQLKPLLLDQTFIAGLGNIYVDEALWEAKLHPRRIAADLSTGEADALFQAIRIVLRRGIANQGTTLGTGKANFYSVSRRQGQNAEQLQVFRRTNAPCPRCQTAIERIIVGQRSTHICPNCQKL